MKNKINFFRSIENRALISLMIIGFVPLVISFMFDNIIIADSLLKLEKKNIQTLSNQISLIIEEELNELLMTVKDESVWDEAYEKIEEKDYIWFKKNFSGWMPANFDIDLSVVMNMSKEVIDEYGLKNKDISQLLSISDVSKILKAPYGAVNHDYARGILMLDDKPYLFCAGPMLKNDYKGERRGLLLVGKSISSKYISEIEKVLGQKIFMTFGDTVVYSDKTSDSIGDYINTSSRHRGSDSISFINNEILYSADVGSVLNGPSSEVTIIMERDIFLQTKRTMTIGSGGIVWLVFVFIVIAGIFLKKYTAFPLKNFENQIYRMGEKNVISYVDTEGPEEIKRLTETFNLMVTRLNEQSIENQNLKSELEYDKLRSEFLANISHEFKTPLNVIFGTTQLIELFIKKDPKDKLALNVKEHVYVMRQNCYRLLRLVNNLIDLTKISSEAFKIHLQNYNIVSLVEDITLSVAKYTERMNIFVGFDTDIEEKVIACDPDQVERIILNLLSNAIKFTESGGEIWVIVNDLGGKLLITVKDTGKGIPEDQLEKIFERFTQVDSSFTRSHEGSGIGLSLVKSLVELHKGTIKVKSVCGKGSEFIIELPAEVLPEQQEVDGKNSFTVQDKVERMHIEFSDIYSY